MTNVIEIYIMAVAEWFNSQLKKIQFAYKKSGISTPHQCDQMTVLNDETSSLWLYLHEFQSVPCNDINKLMHQIIIYLVF